MARLILTHEQADFDALASLLAASLLDPSARPVLPRRLNRNVKAFLTIYSRSLPFSEFEELERGRIESITLVDTQSLISVKGFSDRTQVHIIDHHLREELPEQWTTKIEPLGATTTLLVESLREADQHINSVQATLLILGIYEDTGSLLYPGTDARDIHACAWLLNQGASLEIASEYLNLPLSADQLRLYESLLASAETIEVHDLEIVIAMAAVEGASNEISTLAHKLRDVFDAAGLFVLVKLNGSIQLVARSTTVLINVADIAEHLGGGGHSRAAAALIKSSNLQEAREKLIVLLKENVVPSITVGEIMSRGAKVLNAQDQIKGAAVKMQRSGHEGYPVISTQKVVGLLTRRAVDRAISHGMGEHAISEVMEGGELIVHTDQSIRHLQQEMIEHNWGQVPVTDRETGEIIGIVTRTDLLKALAMSGSKQPTSSLLTNLEATLAPARLALLKLISSMAEASGLALYLVGGFVRDLWLGMLSADFDFVVEGDAIALAQKLVQTYGGRLSTHPRFGTAKWQIEAEHPAFLDRLGKSMTESVELPSTVDFVTARTEFYTHPSALPSVTEGSIKLDLHRRDFSINTLAMRLDGNFYGQVLDHWGGGRDLEQQRIRVLHSLSFIDDPTRMLRAVKLEQRLEFKMEPRTMQLLENAKSLLGSVTGERLRSEIELIFREPKLSQIMKRLVELELLTAIHPTLQWDEWLQERMDAVHRWEPPDEWDLQESISKVSLFYSIWMNRLEKREREDLCERFHLPLAIVDAIQAAADIGCDLTKKLRPSEMVQCLEGMSEAALVAAWLIHANSARARTALDAYLRTYRHVRSHADGETLRAQGIPPGPVYKEILWRLRQAWLDGEVKDEQAEEQLMRRLISEI